VVTLKLRGTDFKIITRRRALPVPTQTAKTLFEVGRELLAKEANGKHWRLIGIGMAELIEAAAVEHDFFAGAERRALVEETAVDRLRARFGPGAVMSGRALGAKRSSED
jgi:DNA polymerase-4